MRLTLAMVFVMSICLGSFYNVVALRTLKKESLSFPPSHCTICNHRLGVIDLVPVISWLILGGKCRYCNTHISKLYPLGELLTAISYTLIIYVKGFNLEAVPHIILVTVLSMSTITDLKEMVVPDVFILVGVLTNLITRVIIHENVFMYVISGLCCFIILITMGLISKGGIGGADIKMYGLIGLTIGFAPGMLSLFYASLVGVIYNIPSLIGKYKGKKTEVPFIPLIYVGVILTYIIPVDIILKM